MSQPDTILTIHVTPEQRERIEQLARERGYDSPDDYLLALVETDSTQSLDFDTKEGVLAGLRESLRQAVNGEIRPVSELWDALDDE